MSVLKVFSMLLMSAATIVWGMSLLAAVSATRSVFYEWFATTCWQWLVILMLAAGLYVLTEIRDRLSKLPESK